MFPQIVHYARSDTSGWKIRDWDTANKLLDYLEPERLHFASFTLPDDSYVQCIGKKTALAIEAREYFEDGSFTHWVFGKGALVGREVRVGGTPGTVGVDESQVLKMRDARRVIRQFLETRTYPDQYAKQDISARFL